MKTSIYTIPMLEAFEAHDECPFCFIERKLEQEAIEFVMGPSYMEEDIHDDTDRLGFCRYHHKMMYDYGNSLGIALMLQTYHHKINKELSDQIKAFSPKKSSLMTKFKSVPDDVALRAPETSIGKWIAGRESTCYVCNHFQSKYPRYIGTFLHMITKDKDFVKMFEESKGFCLHHFKDIVEAAEVVMTDKEKQEFYPKLFKLMEENMLRVQGDIDWFTDKFDYRNKDADWKNSKDANQRGIQKLRGGYPADPVFRKHL